MLPKVQDIIRATSHPEHKWSNIKTSPEIVWERIECLPAGHPSTRRFLEVCCSPVMVEIFTGDQTLATFEMIAVGISHLPSPHICAPKYSQWYSFWSSSTSCKDQPEVGSSFLHLVEVMRTSEPTNNPPPQCLLVKQRTETGTGQRRPQKTSDVNWLNELTNLGQFVGLLAAFASMMFEDIMS